MKDVGCKVLQGFIETEGVTFDLDCFSLFNKCSLYNKYSYLKLKQVIYKPKFY